MKTTVYAVLNSSGAESAKLHTSLGRVIQKESTESTVTVILQEPFWDQRKLEVPRGMVLAYLNNPSKGVVFGHKLNEIYQGQIGDLHYFTQVEAKIQKKLQSSYDDAIAAYGQHNLWKRRLAEQPLYFKVLAKTSKHAGYFKPHKDGADVVITLNDQGFLDEYGSYIWIHELAHALHWFYLRDNSLMQARWTSLYLDSIAGESFDTKMLRALWKSLIQHESVAQWRKSFEEDSPERGAAKAVLAYLKQAHKCSPQDVTALLLGGRDNEAAIDRLKALWPTETIHGYQVAPMISEYASTNVRETVAEAISYYMTDKVLPKRVTKLVEATLVACQK